MGSSAYLHALDFARARKQGVVFGQKAGDQVPIIKHPDIRKNLLLMKSYTEGIKALLLYTIHCMDLMNVTQDKAEKQKYSDLIEVLTPICKAYGAEKSFENCVTAVQVHGGYGYCRDYYVEQLMRDCKITTIYEGTNGIQANDLLGRKIVMRDGAAFQTLLSEIYSVIESTQGIDGLSPYADDMEDYVHMLADISEQLRGEMSGGNAYLAYSWASQYLNLFGDIVLGWMFLAQAQIAYEKRNTIFDANGAVSKVVQDNIAGSDLDAIFYTSKINTAKFFIGSVLPQVKGKIDAIWKNDDAFLKMEDKFFLD